MKTMVLVLDDEPNIRQDLDKYLKKEGYDVCPSESIEDANKIIQVERVDFAIIDLKIDYRSEYGGLKVIENINKLQPKTKVIVLSGYELTPEIKKHLERVSYSGFVCKGVGKNYISEIINQLKKLRAERAFKKCFVIMPFSSTRSCTEQEWLDIFENIIKPSVQKSGYHYECVRSNLVIGNIIQDIIDNLNRADVVIADMTDRNPNVFYELGVRHSLRDATILITQNIEDIPFDLRQYAIIKYDWKTKNGREEFKKKIIEVLKEIEKDPSSSKMISPVREYLTLKTSG